jgi:histidine triad (HIT) family protein
MADKTLFEKIVDREIPAYIVWEDDHYCAFLTPFANTPGVTVVVPKQNPGDDIFTLDDAQITGLMLAAKKVARTIKKGLGVSRVAVVFEGEAVPHVHAKLYPMHDLDKPRQHPDEAFFMSYPGFITTQEGPKMDDAQLQAIQAKLKAASDEN